MHNVVHETLLLVRVVLAGIVMGSNDIISQTTS